MSETSIEAQSAEQYKRHKDSAETFSALADAHFDYDGPESELPVTYEAVNAAMKKHDEALANGKQFKEAHNGALVDAALKEDQARTEAIVDQSAQLYAAENEAVSVDEDYAIIETMVDEESEDLFRHASNAYDDRVAAAKASDTFAQQNIDVLHEAALREAEKQKQ